jgi:hypothetical protein
MPDMRWPPLALALLGLAIGSVMAADLGFCAAVGA